MLFTALPQRDRPIRATVGPMTTGGSSLFTQAEPVFLMIRAMITYTRPANTAPRKMPRKPKATAPHRGLMKAKEEPKNTGLFFLVAMKR